MTTTTTNFIICALLLLCSATALLVKAEDDTLQSKCSEDFTKVASCLSFVSAKANQPTKECCTSVTQIRKDDPVCLCFFIQMASNGSAEQVKSLGVKVSQLLLLPSACKLANSNISDCPTLLGLPANSPAAKVFTNLTTPSTEGTTTTAPTTTTSSRNDTGGSAAGLNHVAAFLVAITVAVSMSLVFVLA
uniref:Bifunctional inhibitor/plant lipid transfer protein/seed storage helical domain-containing protein n=1 Tax=Kalanchoe fedtschenkoi TaxID=63787 RepID=A0A7N0ZVY7_KALFE